MLKGLEACVVGSGVIGLATARALAMSGADVVVIERGKTFGLATSSRNSAVSIFLYRSTLFNSLNRWCTLEYTILKTL